MGSSRCADALDVYSSWSYYCYGRETEKLLILYPSLTRERAQLQSHLEDIDRGFESLTPQPHLAEPWTGLQNSGEGHRGDLWVRVGPVLQHPSTGDTSDSVHSPAPQHKRCFRADWPAKVKPVDDSTWIVPAAVATACWTLMSQRRLIYANQQLRLMWPGLMRRHMTGMSRPAVLLC